MDENAWKSVESEESEAMAINEQVNLVLNKNKEGEVEGNVWKGITFKSITFKEQSYRNLDNINVVGIYAERV